MEVERIIESIHPRTEKERKKLTKILSQVCIRDCEDHRIIYVPADKMGIIHAGDWYCWNTIRYAEEVAVYEESRRRKASCVKDCYERYWYLMEYDDDVYDDFHMVYVGVKDEPAAAMMYDRTGMNIGTYILPTEDDHIEYPYFNLNESSELRFATKDMSTTKEEYLELLLANNQLL